MPLFEFTHDASSPNGHQQLKLAQEHYDEGKVLFREKNYETALVEYQKALALREPHLGKYSMKTILVYFRMGRCHAMLAKSDETNEHYQQAVQSFKRARRLAERSQGEDAEFTTTLSDGIARYLSAEDIAEDESVSKRLSNASTHNTPDLFKKMEQSLQTEKKGDVATKNKQFRKAILHYRSAIKLEQEIMAVSGEQEDSTVTSTSSLDSLASLDGADISVKIAEVYKLQGDKKSTLDFFNAALNSYKEFWGTSDHPAIFGATANIKALSGASEQPETAPRSRGIRGMFSGRRRQ